MGRAERGGDENRNLYQPPLPRPVPWLARRCVLVEFVRLANVALAPVGRAAGVALAPVGRAAG
ncbi:MAG TPA: hypothetical protein VFS00_34290, partial [Polyangiaceae bacterium]|nr:hypothetical protein [Polyangiaceae bacterium]